MAYHRYKYKPGGYYRNRNRYGRYSTSNGCLTLALLVFGIVSVIGYMLVSII